MLRSVNIKTNMLLMMIKWYWWVAMCYNYCSSTCSADIRRYRAI